MYKFWTLVVSILIFSNGYSQGENIELRGSVSGCQIDKISIRNAKNGPFVIFEEESIITLNDSFVFNGLIINPTIIMLYADFDSISYFSNWFYVDAGIQNLSVTCDGENLVVTSDGKSSKYYKNVFKTKMDSFTKTQTTKNIDLFLNAFVSNNPNSNVALMELYYSIHRYNRLFDTILGKFDPSLQESYLGKKISAKLSSYRTTEVGSIFPNIKIKDTNDSEAKLQDKLNKKYILLDFWHHGCGYCIQGFPKLKEMSEKYANKDFEIVSISTDRPRNKAEWLNMINKHDLSWSHYIDYSSEESKEIGISYFPTYILMDSDRLILSRSHSVEETENFIKMIMDK